MIIRIKKTTIYIFITFFRIFSLFFYSFFYKQQVLYEKKIISLYRPKHLNMRIYMFKQITTRKSYHDLNTQKNNQQIMAKKKIVISFDVEVS